MKYKTRIKWTAILICLVAPLTVFAESRYEQKLILVEGTESRFMDGEPKPVFNFNKDEVLPYLLSRGWRIVSVHVNDKSKEERLYGYVVVERDISSNQ